MIRTIEAIIDPKGHINLSEPVKLSSSCRALVLILDKEPLININEKALKVYKLINKKAGVLWK